MSALFVAALIVAQGGPASLEEDPAPPVEAPPSEPTAQAAMEGGSTVVIGDQEESPPAAIGPTPVTRHRIELDSRLLGDTRFESAGEDVVEWWNILRLRLEHQPSAPLRLVFEAWARWGVVGKDPRPDHRFWLVNARAPRYTGEVELREAFANLKLGVFEARVGQQLFAWGKNEVFAAADIVNPLDLRFDPVTALESTKDAKAPTFALDVGAFEESFSLELVLLPFFTKNRGFLVGRDFAVAPPGSQLAGRVAALGNLDPTVSDELQQAVQGTREPGASPADFSWATRATARVLGWDLAATAYYGWDRTPRVRVDPDLATLLGSADRLLANPELIVTDPALRDAGLGVQQKRLAGLELVRSTFNRMWRLALEAQGVVGDLVLRADVGLTPRATFYTGDYLPVTRSTATGALGAEYTYGESFYAALTGYSLIVPNAPSWGRLLSLERESVNPSGRDTVALYGLLGHMRWRWDEEGLAASLMGAWNIAPGDRVLWAEAQYDHLEPHVLKVGVMLMTGPRGTTGWTYASNDLCYIAYSAAW